MKTTKTTKTNKTNKGTFETLLREYEKQTRLHIDGKGNETEYTKALQTLATACTFSVLKKLCNVGGTIMEEKKHISDSAKVVRQLRTTLFQDLRNIENLYNAVNNSSEYQYNENGDIVEIITDKELHNAIPELLRYSYDDGLDLLNTAIIAILDETAKAQDLNSDFMEKPYTVRRLKRKVYIKKEDSKNGFETVNTTPITEVYKAIRREIQNSRSIQVASHKYTYIEDIAKDTETDTEVEIFKRLPKYSGLAYEMTDYNGKTIAITADNSTVDSLDGLISKLNPSKQQAEILQLRLSGYGYKAIATYLGVREDNVKLQIKRLQAKLKDFGLEI